ncbi:NSP1 [Sanghuangporus vaninii]
MSEPLKGGFSSFASGTSFKPPGAAGTPPPATTPFNTAQNTGTNAQTTNTPSAFGSGASGGTSLFGNFGAKPATSSIFGSGTSGTTSTTGAGGSNLFTGFGSNASTNPIAQGASPSPAAASISTPGGGLFAAKPPEQTANTNPSGTPSAPQPGASLFGGSAGNTSAAQPAPTATTTGTQNLFGKPAETNTSTTAPAAGAQTGGSLFGNATFGKKPDTPTTQGTTPASSNPTPASLFAGFGAKKDDGADKDKQQTAPTAGGGAFGQASSNKDTPAATGSTFNMFGKPAEKKDAPTEGEKKDGTAGASSGVNTSDKPTGTGTPTPISVPPPSMLRGKTIEEIVNKWSSELETNVREFNGLAGEIAVWDRALIDNGNTIAALLQHIMMAEREQSDIEQSLKHVEDQQKELASTLEVYEKAAGEIFDAQGGGLRALDVGPADAERDKHYTLAAELNTNLDDLSRSLLQMIESVNSLSESENIGCDVSMSKGDAPLEQIAQILSSHLESLQWIDSAVKEVENKVTDVERLVRDASVNGSRTGGGGSGSFKESANGLRGSRGFGLR